MSKYRKRRQSVMVDGRRLFVVHPYDHFETACPSCDTNYTWNTATLTNESPCIRWDFATHSFVADCPETNLSGAALMSAMREKTIGVDTINGATFYLINPYHFDLTNCPACVEPLTWDAEQGKVIGPCVLFDLRSGQSYIGCNPAPSLQIAQERHAA